VTLVRGVQTWGTPKGHERSEIPIAKFLVEELSTHMQRKQPDDLVLTGVKGGALRSQVFQRSILTKCRDRTGTGRTASTRAPAHRREPGHRGWRRRQSRTADARAKLLILKEFEK